MHPLPRHPGIEAPTGVTQPQDKKLLATVLEAAGSTRASKNAELMQREEQARPVVAAGICCCSACITSDALQQCKEDKQMEDTHLLNEGLQGPCCSFIGLLLVAAGLAVVLTSLCHSYGETSFSIWFWTLPSWPWPHGKRNHSCWSWHLFVHILPS